jgi:hypothetical protein
MWYQRALAFSAALLVTSAFAWGKEGHQMVAKLVETQLTAKARTEATVGCGPSEVGQFSQQDVSVNCWDDFKERRCHTNPGSRLP